MSLLLEHAFHFLQEVLKLHFAGLRSHEGNGLVNLVDVSEAVGKNRSGEYKFCVILHLELVKNQELGHRLFVGLRLF